MSDREKDYYDKAVDYFSESPGMIESAWLIPASHRAGSLLFSFAGVNRSGGDPDNRIGCLSMIRTGRWEAETSGLTKRIRADKRIPTSVGSGLTRAELEAFAEWQRTIDKELRREEPVWPAELEDQ